MTTEPLRHRFRAMGTVCELVLEASSPERARRCAALAEAEVARLEARYSRYRDDSLLAQINRAAAAGESIEVDDETAALLDYADACFAESDGLFDVTSGILRRAWRFDAGRLPEPAEVEALLDRVGWQKLRWRRPRLEFPQRGVELDLGGIVKEYAADRVAALCREHGARHGMVNLGGDIGILGPRADGRPWRIGLRDPLRPGALVRTVELASGALATSGDTERCIVVGGVRYGHVLSPKTGWPVRHLAAVSVAAELCTVAGSAATIALLRAEAGPAWLAESGLPHLWVDAEGGVGGSWGLGDPRPLRH